MKFTSVHTLKHTVCLVWTHWTGLLFCCLQPVPPLTPPFVKHPQALKLVMNLNLVGLYWYKCFTPRLLDHFCIVLLENPSMTSAWCGSDWLCHKSQLETLPHALWVSAFDQTKVWKWLLLCGFCFKDTFSLEHFNCPPP